MNNTTDSSQEFAQTTKNTNESATNPTNNYVSNSISNKKSIITKAIQTEKPLIIYFDLVDEANNSYVLGYN